MYIYKLLILILMGLYIYIEFSIKVTILLFYRFVSNFEQFQIGTAKFINL